jgi:hypothetical protein
MNQAATSCSMQLRLPGRPVLAAHSPPFRTGGRASRLVTESQMTKLVRPREPSFSASWQPRLWARIAD